MNDLLYDYRGTVSDSELPRGGRANTLASEAGSSIDEGALSDPGIPTSAHKRTASDPFSVLLFADTPVGSPDASGGVLDEEDAEGVEVGVGGAGGGRDTPPLHADLHDGRHSESSSPEDGDDVDVFELNVEEAEIGRASCRERV